jgi:hypothetical protein
LSENKVREAVGVFHDEHALRTAADELMVAGFDRSALNLLASERAVQEKLGHDYTKVGEIEDDDTTPRLAYIGRDSRVESEAALAGGLAYVGAVSAIGAIVASGGTIAAALIGAAAAVGTGGVIGAFLGRFIDRHHARYLEDQLDRGGLLLWVATKTPEQEQKATELLERNGAADVHVHDLSAAQFTYEGGESFDLSFMKKLGM